GYLMKPTIVKQAVHEGKIIKSFSPEIVRKVLSPETVRAMKEILTQAVHYGTGKNASIPGYLVGGKTGTAQKIDPDTKKYSANNYVSSFVGFVPVENPKLTILVMIDEPRGIYWGGSVAAPVFREIAKKALRHLNVSSGMNRIYTLSTKSDKSNHSRLNAGLGINSVHNNINLKIRESIDKFLGRVIAGLKNHYWEKDKKA
ncbi:MAG: penicillin-binding transpeptidase domain-containing protein, partial [Nitrospinota bacterium]